MAAGAVFAGIVAGAGADAAVVLAGVGAAAAAANQSFTPLWPAQAPFFVSLDVYEPSLHKPVKPLGAAAGACANAATDVSVPTRNVKGLPTFRPERESAKMVGVQSHPSQATERGSLVEQITRGAAPRATVTTTIATTTPARGQAVRVGVDLAKRVIQVHAVDSAGRVLASRALNRDKFIAWCAQLPPACIVAMETSSSAHHWSRKLIATGLDARIIAAQLVSPYRKQGASGKTTPTMPLPSAKPLVLTPERSAHALRARQEHRAAKHAVRAPPA